MNLQIERNGTYIRIRAMLLGIEPIASGTLCMVDGRWHFRYRGDMLVTFSNARDAFQFAHTTIRRLAWIRIDDMGLL